MSSCLRGRRNLSNEKQTNIKTSLHTTTYKIDKHTEPAHLEPVLRNRRGRDSERPAHHDEEWPPLAATGESPGTETKTQHSHR